MADEEEGEVAARAEVVQQVEDAGLDGDVQGRGRLVQEDQVRAGGERHGDGDALFHAAGELVRVGVHEGGRARKAGFGEEGRGLGAGGGAGEPGVNKEGLGDLQADGEGGVEG